MNTRLNDRVNEIAAEVKRFETRMGLDGLKPEMTQGAAKYLNLNEDEFYTMTVEELAVGSLAVANLGFQIQNEYCKCSSEAKRLSNAVKRLVADVVAKSAGFQYEERLLSAIAKNSVAQRLDLKSQDLQQKADRLAYLAKQAEFVAGLMMNLSGARRRDRRD